MTPKKRPYVSPALVSHSNAGKTVLLACTGQWDCDEGNTGIPCCAPNVSLCADFGC